MLVAPLALALTALVAQPVAAQPWLAAQPVAAQPWLAAQPVVAQSWLAAQPPAVDYIWPTEGTIIDAFRAPKSRYGPGNRGLEFATAYGSTFWAAAAGIVSFAGQVGGRLHVTVAHADGLRTSYSDVLSIAQPNIKKGARVSAGQILGTTNQTLHVGVRRGDTYLDPELIFPPRSSSALPNRLRRARLIPTGRLPPRLVLLI